MADTREGKGQVSATPDSARFTFPHSVPLNCSCVLPLRSILSKQRIRHVYGSSTRQSMISLNMTTGSPLIALGNQYTPSDHIRKHFCRVDA
jgi:hypothetical protein